MGRIAEFLKLFNSPKTKNAYKWCLGEFFKYLYPESSLEESGERYFSETRNYEDDISNFLSSINGSKAPKSVKLMITTVRSFLIENDVELSEKFWRRLKGRVKGSRTRTLDNVPSNLELRKAIMMMPPNGKALYLVLSSSGMRIGETLKLQIEDLNFDYDPVRVNIRGDTTKTGNSRIAFISGEAKEAVEEWLKVRNQYLKAASGKSHKYGKSVEDSRLFPFLDNTAYMVLNNALEKSGFLKRDKSTNRKTVHPHVLRKFFRTRMATLIPVDIVEALMGHEGYLTEVYRRYTTEDLAKFYKQGESSLSVFSAGEDLKFKQEFKEQNEELRKLVISLTSETQALKTESLESKRQISRMEEENKSLLELRECFKSSEDMKRFFDIIRGEWILSSPDGRVLYLGLKDSTYTEFMLSLGRIVAEAKGITINEAITKVMDILTMEKRPVDKDFQKIYDKIVEAAKEKDEANRGQEKATSET